MRCAKRLLSGLVIVLAILPSLSSVRSQPAPRRQAQSQRPQLVRRMNVLFISVDDLRPELGCYGVAGIKSPNIDALAKRGLLFNRAYCQQAVCSPSRSSLMTGRRPDTTKVYDNATHFRQALPDVVTLSQHFKNHGYHAQGLNKIFHGQFNDDEPSWSVSHWKPKASLYGPAGHAQMVRAKEEAKKAGGRPFGSGWLPWEAPDVTDNSLQEGETADYAIKVLNEVKDKPFFLAVGFQKPHLPFVAPKKYWDMYAEKDLKLARNPFPPKDAPVFALHDWPELRVYQGIPKTGPLSAEQARTMVHGYYACISYMDAQVGRVLDELDRLGLRDNTVIVLWGDHGWQLGEHGLWCKHTNYEISTRAPLIVSTPDQKSAGKRTDALVELVDLYPTLAELCELPLPEGLEGTSFKLLIENPQRAWKLAAFSQYPRNVPGRGRSTGYAIRTERYRLVGWRVEGKDSYEYELYDHRNDPAENVNIAKRPEHAATVKRLTALLSEGWRAAQPPRK